jgi:hypothetical protein
VSTRFAGRISPSGDVRGGGYISVAALIVLPAVVLLAVASSVALQSGERYLRRVVADRRVREQARAAVIEVIELMRADATPQAHSRHDPLWRRRPHGVEITAILPHERCVAGLRCLSRYAYVNVNVAPVSLLETVVGARLPMDARSAAVLEPILTARRAGELFSPESLRFALGTDHQALAPVLTAHPLVNVNTAPAAVIEKVLASEAPTADVSRALGRVLHARERAEIVREDLPELLAVDEEARVLSFLGVRSFTLGLLIARGDRRYEAVIARIPDAVGAGGLQVLRFSEVRP